jgi:acetyl esterase/lipase
MMPMRHRTLASLSIFALAISLPGTHARAQQTVLPLWPNGTPEPAQTTEPETDVTKPTDALYNGRRSIRYSNVIKPTLTVYPPPASIKNTGAAALVFPGGSYVRLSWNGEGTDTCDWVNSIGITCILVKYRVPETVRYPQNFADFEDAQQAMRLTRVHAAEWHIDPARVGTIGFSAGAHLVVALAAHWDDHHVESTPAAAEVDAKIDARPDFNFVIYPGWIAIGADRSAIDPALTPALRTPPTFILQAEDDNAAHVESSLVYYRALLNAKIPVEMHLFATGGHGFGVHPTGKPEEHWTDLATTWLRSIGIIP